MLKRLLLNSAVFGLAPYLPRILAVFLLPVLTKYLTEDDYGIIGTVTAYTSALSAFTTLGLTQVLFNSFYHSKCQYKWIWRELYGFLQIWILLFGIIQAVILYFILPEEAADNKYSIILLSSFTLLFSGTALLGNTYFQLPQNPLPIAIRTVFSGTVTIIVNYFLVVFLKMGYLGFFLATCIGTVLVNISYIRVVCIQLGFSPIYKFKLKTISRSLRISLPIIPHTYSAYMLNTSNRLVMDRFHMPIAIIGEFNIAQQFSNLIDSFTGAVNQAINPMTLDEIRNNNHEGIHRLIYIYMTITLLVTFLVSLWLKEIFYLLISNDVLRKTYPYAIILIMAQNAKPMYVASSNVFFYYENTKSLLKITFVAGIMSLFGYIIFIPLLGVWGAVVVYYVSMIYMGYAGFFFDFFRMKTLVLFPIFKILITSVIFTIVAFVLVDSLLLVKVVTSLMLLTAMFVWVYKMKLYKI